MIKVWLSASSFGTTFLKVDVDQNITEFGSTFSKGGKGGKGGKN